MTVPESGARFTWTSWIFIKIQTVLFWIDITFPSAGDTASSSSPGGVLSGSRKNIMKKIDRINPITNNKNKIADVPNEPDTLLKATHEAIVKRKIPKIHGNEPLAIILKNSSHKVQDAIDHIDYLRKDFKDSISYQE